MDCLPVCLWAIVNDYLKFYGICTFTLNDRLIRDVCMRKDRILLRCVYDYNIERYDNGKWVCVMERLNAKQVRFHDGNVLLVYNKQVIRVNPLTLQNDIVIDVDVKVHTVEVLSDTLFLLVIKDGLFTLSSIVCEVVNGQVTRTMLPFEFVYDHRIQYMGENRLVVARGKKIDVWNLKTKERERRLSGLKVRCFLRLSNHLLLAIYECKTLQIWNIDSGEGHQVHDDPFSHETPTRLVLLNDGRILDHLMHVWNPKTWECEMVVNGQPWTKTTTTPEGDLITCSWGRIQFWK